MSHLEALIVAHAITIVQPFFGGGKKEIVKRPKVYGFDTGFVTLIKGSNKIRESDRGLLWEHLVLDMLRVSYGSVYYLTDKEQNEIDFIVKGKGDEFHTMECKINPDRYSDRAIKKFRTYYPEGKNYCFSPQVKKPYKISKHGIEIFILSVADDLE